MPSPTPSLPQLMSRPISPETVTSASPSLEADTSLRPVISSQSSPLPSRHLSIPSSFPFSQSLPSPSSLDQSSVAHTPPPPVSTQERNLRVEDPILNHDRPGMLSDPALSTTDWQYLQDFHGALRSENMEFCRRCRERWFSMNLKEGVCTRCETIDRKRTTNEPYMFSWTNKLDSGDMPNLPELTQVEEMLIARVHVFVELRQVRGQQYKYKSHVVNFLRNTARLFNSLPLLPEHLDIILLRPSNSNTDPRLNQQFC